MNWELLVVGIFLAIALKSIADALLIVAQRLNTIADVVRLMYQARLATLSHHTTPPPNEGPFAKHRRNY